MQEEKIIISKQLLLDKISEIESLVDPIRLIRAGELEAYNTILKQSTPAPTMDEREEELVKFLMMYLEVNEDEVDKIAVIDFLQNGVPEKDDEDGEHSCPYCWREGSKPCCNTDTCEAFDTDSSISSCIHCGAEMRAENGYWYHHSQFDDNGKLTSPEYKHGVVKGRIK